MGQRTTGIVGNIDMVMNSEDLYSQNWYHANHNLKNEQGRRLFYFETGCAFPFKENGATWYRISCSYWFGDWIEEYGNTDQWRAHGGRHRAIYIVREDLMTFIKLRWL